MTFLKIKNGLDFCDIHIKFWLIKLFTGVTTSMPAAWPRRSRWPPSLPSPSSVSSSSAVSSSSPSTPGRRSHRHIGGNAVVVVVDVGSGGDVFATVVHVKDVVAIAVLLLMLLLIMLLQLSLFLLLVVVVMFLLLLLLMLL